MRSLYLVIILGLVIFPVYGEEAKNPSLIIDQLEIQSGDFNKVARDTIKVSTKDLHESSWQITIDNNLIYANPNGNAVVRFYDHENPEKFIEVGMGANPNYRFWASVQTPKEGYVLVKNYDDRGWNPATKVLLSYTDIAGLSINNGERIVISNLDVGKFSIDSYSVFGMESSTDPPATSSGSLLIELMSGDPSKNIFHLYPFYITAGIAVIVGVLFLVTKRRS